MPSLTVSSSSLLFSTTFSTQTYRSMSNLYTQPTLSPSEPKPTVSPTSAAPTLPAPSQSPIACKFSRRCQNAIRANLTSRLACTPENACDNAEGLIGTGSCVHDFACQNKTGVCTDIYRTVLNCTQLIQIFQGNVGDLSCIGVESCQSSTGSIGDNSCLVEDGTDEDSPSRSCMENAGSIGSGSCIGEL